MEKDKIFAIVEPTRVMPVWFEKGISGLRETASKHRLKLHFIKSIKEIENYPISIHSMVVVSTRIDWTQQVLHSLRNLRIKPILIGTIPSRFGEYVSGAILNHAAFIETLVYYFYLYKRRRIALVGVNPNSSNDNNKCEIFISSTKYLGIEATQKDIFYTDNDIINAVESFCRRANKYNAVICSNDYVAVYLLRALQMHDIKSPDDLFVTGLGNMIIGCCTTPTLTSFTLNYHEAGVQAVHIWELLQKNSSVTSMITTIKGEIICRGSTAFSPPPTPIVFSSQRYSTPHDISTGSTNLEIRSIENCLMQCDELDFKAIYGILKGNSYENIADSLFISLGSLRYRLKKMYSSLGVASRVKFETTLRKYINNVEALKELSVLSNNHFLRE